jgi:hypothetical protein
MNLAERRLAKRQSKIRLYTPLRQILSTCSQSQLATRQREFEEKKKMECWEMHHLSPLLIPKENYNLTKNSNEG